MSYTCKCDPSSTCAEIFPATCVVPTNITFPDCFEELDIDTSCVKSIAQVDSAQNTFLCALWERSKVNITSSCVTLPPAGSAPGVYIVQLYDENCALKTRVQELENTLDNILDAPINTTGFNLNCLPDNPCNPGGAYTTLRDLLQAMLNKTCECCA